MEVGSGNFYILKRTLSKRPKEMFLSLHCKPTVALVGTRLGNRAYTRLTVTQYSSQSAGFRSVVKQYIIRVSQLPLSYRSLNAMITAHLLLSDETDESKLIVHIIHA